MNMLQIRDVLLIFLLTNQNHSLISIHFLYSIFCARAKIDDFVSKLYETNNQFMADRFNSWLGSTECVFYSTNANGQLYKYKFQHDDVKKKAKKKY